jgi:hypothetical protein
MRVLFPILFFLTTISSIGQTKIKVGQSVNIPQGVKKITLIKSTTLVGAGQKKVVISGGYALLLTPVVAVDNFHLDTSSITSVGVYATDSVTLLRTIFNNVRLPAGNYSVDSTIWDGKDDAGNVLGVGSYIVKMLSNNVKYTWEGIIGNTSDSLIGSKVWNNPDGGFWDMVVYGNYAYCGAGFNEGRSSHLKFNIARPKEKLYASTFTSHGIGTERVATDGVNVYWAGRDANPGTGLQYSVVVATKVTDDTEVIFPNGQSFATQHARTYPSGIGRLVDVNHEITGLAVQKTGNYLFFSRGYLDTLYVYHKTTGALVRKDVYNSVRHIRLRNDNELWMVTGKNRIGRYIVNSNGSLTSTTDTLLGTIEPLALGFSITGDTLAVNDGSRSSQQVKFYNPNTRALFYTFGQAGGYYTNTLVANDKFYFSNTKEFKPNSSPHLMVYTFTTFFPDGSFWVGDQGNLRAQHFAQNRTFIESIMNMGYFYSTASDVNAPTRVFANFLEFQRNYSLPLSHTNGSWTLIRNFGGSVDSLSDNQYFRLRDVTTFPSGRTYAIVPDPNSATVGDATLVELPTNGSLLRYTNLSLGPYNAGIRVVLNSDGSIGQFNQTELGAPAIYQRRYVTGYDGSNNPIYGSPVNIATFPAITINDPVGGGPSSLQANQISSNNLVVVHNHEGVLGNGRGGTGSYRLGAVKVGASQYLWKSMPATFPAYRGPYPDNGSFDIGNGVAVSGSMSKFLGRSVFTSYHGEFHISGGGQVNKWDHFYDNGLMIGQLGITAKEAYEIIGESPPMIAGNVLQGAVVKINDSTYALYHNDENAHGGIGTWKIAGVNTIKEQNKLYTKVLSGVIPKVLPYVNLLDSIPYLNARFTNDLAGWTVSRAIDTTTFNTTNFFDVRTNIYEYKKDSNDIVIRSYGNISTNVIRDLRVLTDLATWRIEGKILYPEPSESPAPHYNRIEIRDLNNKIIIQINRGRDVTINGIEILPYNGLPGQSPTGVQTPRPFKFGWNGTQVWAQYNGGPIITAAIFDGTANPLRPKTLEFPMFSNNGGGHMIDFANPKMYSTVN